MATPSGHMRVTIQDEKLAKAAIPIYWTIPDAATIAELGTEMGLVLAALNDCTKGTIIGAEIRLNVALPSANAGTGSDVNAAVGLSFPVPSTGRQYPLAIPARADATLSGGEPDMTDGNALDVFADILEAAMTTTALTTGHYQSSAFQNLGANARGYLPDRKFAKRLQGLSRRAGA